MSEMVAELTPRNVNYDLIGKYVDKQVSIHGKVDSVRNNTAYIITQEEQEGKQIIVNNFNAKAEPGSYIEVIGTVNPDKSINYIHSFPLKSDFDLKLWNKTITLMDSKETEQWYSE